MNDSLLIYIRKNVPINGSITANKAKAIGYLYFLTNLLPLLLFFNSVSYKDLIKRKIWMLLKKLVVLRKNKVPTNLSLVGTLFFNWLNLFTNDFNCVHHDVKCWTVLGIPLDSTNFIHYIHTINNMTKNSMTEV